MRYISFVLLLVALSTFTACAPQQGLLDVQVNENGLVDVVDTQSGETVLRDIYPAYIDADGHTVSVDPGAMTLTRSGFNDKMGSGSELVLQASPAERQSLRWTLRSFTNTQTLAVKLELVYSGDQAVRIEELRPLCSKDATGGIVFANSGDIHYIDIEPETWAPKAIKVLDRQGKSNFVTGLATADNHGAVIGCLSFERFRGHFEFTDQREFAKSLGLTVSHDIDTHLMLDPGETLASEWIYIDCTGNVFDGLEKWASLAGEYNDAVISDPPAAGFYTWYYYRDYVSEKIMLDNTKFLAENRDRFPVEWVHIDWGWQRKFSSGDTTANEKFPHHLSWLAEQIRQAGFAPSIWVNPFMYTTPTSEFQNDNPEMFLQNINGGLAERGPIRNMMARAWGDAEYMILDGVTNILDTTNPDAWDFLHDRYAWVRGMGYDMAMMDFIIMARANYHQGDRFHDPNLSTIEGIRKGLMAAKDGLGEGGNILGCGTIYETCVGTSNLTRISYDAPATWSYAQTSCADLINQYYMNNKLWTNYSDGLFVRDQTSPYWPEYDQDHPERNEIMKLNDDEAQFYTAVSGLSGAAVMYTEDLPRLKADRQRLLSLVLPIYDEGKFRPVDLFQTTRPKLLKRECAQGGRSWVVAAGLNWQDESDVTGLELSKLNLDADQSWHAFDVFGETYLGEFAADANIGPVNPHGALVLGLTPVMERPQLVGTGTHLSQGGVEVAGESWNDANHELTLDLKDLYGRKGNFYIHVPAGYIYQSLTGMEAQPEQNGNLLLLPVVLDGEKSVTLSFGKE